MATIQALESQFEAAWPARSWCDSHVVLAVSGGADSVAMLRAAMTVKQRTGGSGRLFVAHLNHRLRGTAADADANWLRALCVRSNVPIECAEADVAAIAARRGDGLEAAAREARYSFLRRTAERLGARFVALAHTADDQAETVLHRIVRGTGIAGLAGIAEARSLSPSIALVRPLLAVRRCEVLAYLATLGQDYREDQTNADLQWTRNRLRHQLLPMLREQFNADVDGALLRLAAQAEEIQQLLAERADELVADCVTVEHKPRSDAGEHHKAQRIRVHCPALAREPPIVVREVCKAAWTEAAWPQQSMGYDQWQQLAELVRRGEAAAPLNLPGNVRARREAELLVLQWMGPG